MLVYSPSVEKLDGENVVRDDDEIRPSKILKEN